MPRKWTHAQRLNALAIRKEKAEPARKAQQRRQAAELRDEQARLKDEAAARREARSIDPDEPIEVVEEP